MPVAFPLIRKFQPSDRAAVRAICCETALVGRPCSLFFDDDDIFADALTSYFTDHEPRSCFVAESAGEVVGYLLGARDERTMSRLFRRKIFLPLLGRAFTRGVFFRKTNLRFFAHGLLSLVKGELIPPTIPENYPAILHINLRKDFRGKGAGAKLMRAYLDHLIAAGVPGVHLTTMSESAALFFRSQGFQLLGRGKRSYWRYILGTDVPVYFYGKLLSS